MVTLFDPSKWIIEVSGGKIGLPKAFHQIEPLAVDVDPMGRVSFAVQMGHDCVVYFNMSPRSLKSLGVCPTSRCDEEEV